MKLTEEELKNLCAKYIKGATLGKLKREFHLDTATIKSYLKESGIELRSRSQNSRHYKINENFFDEINSQEKAYFLGFLYADGSNDIKRNVIRIGLQAQDKYILEKFRNLIFQEERPLQYIKAKTDAKGRYRKEMWVLQITNKHMSKMLYNLGVVNCKSLILKFPKWIDNKLLPHFIRGYNDGDGCIEDTWKQQCRVEILGTNEFCNSIKNHIIKLFNINSHIRNKNNIYILSINGSYALTFLDWLYNQSTIHLIRKYNKYIELKLAKEKRVEKRYNRKCIICGKKHYAKDLCLIHYTRATRKLKKQLKSSK